MAVNKLDITMMEDVGTSASQLLQRDGSGNLPAVNASQVTGLSEFTTSTSNPVITTNPSGGVGSLWYNKTAGTMYVCTDATAGANVWTNVGAGSGNVQPWAFGGTNYGYTYGDASKATVNQWSLSSDGNATNIGNMSVARNTWGGQSSTIHGYCSGGKPPAAGSDLIEKFAFASGVGTWTDVGNLIEARHYVTSASGPTYGYLSGGAHTGVPSGHTDTIDKFPFASDSNATDVGNLLQRKSGWGGANSETHAYDCGGYPGSHPYLNVIQKYPFATDTNSTDVGDLLAIAAGGSGASSESYGYFAGTENPLTDVIQKWSFTTDGNSTDVGNLAGGNFQSCGVSSLTYGYQAGGAGPSMGNVIQKYSFSADGNSTDVGDLTAAFTYTGNGSQY